MSEDSFLRINELSVSVVELSFIKSGFHFLRQSAFIIPGRTLSFGAIKATMPIKLPMGSLLSPVSYQTDEKVKQEKTAITHNGSLKDKTL